MQAAHRFLANDDLLFATLLQPHHAATEQRISESGEGSVVLVPQNTTSGDFTQLSIKGLGPIGTTTDGRRAMFGP